MIFVARFWDQDCKGNSLEEIHRMVCEEQETETPEYSVCSYESELDYIVRSIPKEFREFVKNYAYQEGHASGEDEVESIAADLVSGLRPAINAFESRLVLRRA